MRAIVLEVNELPWDVLDAHVRRRPSGAFARFVREGACLTTRVDGELHPWIAWATMHRGTGDHGVRFLGQDPATYRGTPIWARVEAAGKAAGVFGSMPSWPARPLRGFHVPDPFGGDTRCHPARLDAFQALMVANVRTCGRVVGSADLGAVDPVGLARLGVRPRTLAAAARQLMDERRDPRLRWRRPVLGARVALDVFVAAWRRARPDYAAFFTNHLAWLMHRYAPGGGFFGDAVAYGMDVADAQLAALRALDPEAVVIVASGLGQRQVREEPTGALRLARVERLVDAVGFDGAWSRGHAMDPDVPVRLADAGAAADLARRVAAVDVDGERLFDVERAEADVLVRVRQVLGAAGVEAWGVERIATETGGCGVHTPHGVLIEHGPGIAPDPRRREVPATSYAPRVLARLGIA